jgi:hypothetical protein
VLGSLSLLELLLAVIDSALFLGAKQSLDIPTLAQSAATRAGEESLVAAWLPRVTRLMLATNAAAAPSSSLSSSSSSSSSSFGVLPTPSQSVQSIYATAASLLERWCRRWPARLTVALRGAQGGAAPSGSSSVASGAAPSGCSCSVLELLLLWCCRLGDGSTGPPSHSQQLASSAAPFASADSPAARLQRPDWQLRALCLLSAQRAVWAAQLERSQSLATAVVAPFCGAHGREWPMGEAGTGADAEADAALLDRALLLLSMPPSHFRGLCAAVEGAVRQLRAGAAAHVAPTRLLHVALGTLHAALVQRRSWRHAEAQLAALDAEAQRRPNFSSAARPAGGGSGAGPAPSVAPGPGLGLLLRRVRDACALLSRARSGPDGRTLPHHLQPQPLWPATIALAEGLGAWFAC